MKAANEQEGKKNTGGEMTWIVKAKKYKGNKTITNGRSLKGKSEKTSKQR